MDMTVTVPAQTDAGSGTPPGAPPAETGGVSSDWSKQEQEMAKIAQELGITPPTPPAAPTNAPGAPQLPVPALPPLPTAPQAQTPAQPTPPAAVTPPPVPEKFLRPDGTVDIDRLNKSYLEAEKALKRAQNQGQAAPPQLAQPQPTAQLSEFEQRVAQDMINDAASMGVKLDPVHAAIQARTQVRLFEASHRASVAATTGEVRTLKESLAERARLEELQTLARVDPGVVSLERKNALSQILEEKPYLWNDPEPWKSANEIYLGRRAVMGSPVPVNTPTPQAPSAQGAPPLPVGAGLTPQPTLVPRFKTEAEMNAYLDTLTPEQEDAFWVKNGQPPMNIRKQGRPTIL